MLRGLIEIESEGQKGVLGMGVEDEEGGGGRRRKREEQEEEDRYFEGNATIEVDSLQDRRRT